MSDRLIRYVSGSSVIHRLDPRSKLVFVSLFIGATLIAPGIIEASLLLLVALAFYFLARLPLRETRSTWKFILIVAVVLSFLNLFTLTLLYPKGEHVLVTYGPLKITVENLVHSVTPILRLLSIATVTLTLIFTTPPNLYAPAIGQLGLPYKVAYVVELSFRYIPEMIGELRKTLEAQMARGYRPRGGKNPVARILQVIPLILPVTVSAALNVYDIADAMELRGFGVGRCYTWYRELRLKMADYIAIMLGISIFSVLLLLRFLK